MPSTISLYAISVWFSVGVCVGGGWAVGTWIAVKLTR
jgi:hypothetical protein